MPPRTRRRSWPHMYVTLLRENGLPAGALLRRRCGVRRRRARWNAQAGGRTWQSGCAAWRRAAGALCARCARRARCVRNASARAGSGVRGCGVPDGVREQVVQAQRGEGGAANGEKGERVAQKGADENQHGEAEVVHAVVVDCPSTGDRACRQLLRGDASMRPPAPAAARTIALQARRPLSPRLGRREAREELCGRDRRRSASAAAFGSARTRAPERWRGHVRPDAPPGGRGFWFQSTCRRRCVKRSEFESCLSAARHLSQGDQQLLRRHARPVHDDDDAAAAQRREGDAATQALPVRVAERARLAAAAPQCGAAYAQ